MLQVAAEFKRITNVDVSVFYGSLDSQLSQLESIFTSGSGKKCDVMKQVMGSVAGNEVSYVYHVLSLWCVSISNSVHLVVESKYCESTWLSVWLYLDFPFFPCSHTLTGVTNYVDHHVSKKIALTVFISYH